MVKRLVCAVMVVVSSLVGGLGRETGAQTTDGFEVVGTNDLSARGMNAGFAVAGDCGYVGSRSADQGTLILDLSEPESPEVTGEIPLNAGSTQREVRAVADLGLLIILNYRLDFGIGGPNSLDLYDISDCSEPEFRSRLDFGESMPHEFYLWRDPSSQYSTAVGTYYVYGKHAPLAWTEWGKAYIKWWVAFDPYRDNGFHSFSLDKKGNVLPNGDGATGGCVATSLGAAEAIYNFATIGMRVEVHQ